VTGHIRLGVVLSALWLIIFPSIYFLGLYMLPAAFADAVWPLYRWLPGAQVEVAPHSYFTQIHPAIKWVAFVLGSLLPVVIPWIVLFVIPQTIRWVQSGSATHKTS
jgi:hypothetical protein